MFAFQKRFPKFAGAKRGPVGSEHPHEVLEKLFRLRTSTENHCLLSLEFMGKVWPEAHPMICCSQMLEHQEDLA